jgi:PKHD-type hydroxylase
MIVLPSMPLRNPNVGLVYHGIHFSPAECDQIVASAIDSEWREGGVGGRGQDKSQPSVASETRSCLEQRLPVDPRSGAPLNKISLEVSAVNANGWRFELSGFVADDMPYLMRYPETMQAHYDWHMDMGRAYAASRKLGFSIQLTESSAYEGGDLEFHNVEIDKESLLKKGTLAIFPTYWLHRVSPVTRGTRDVVVGWVHGPSFR